MPRIMPTDQPPAFQAAVQAAAELLRAGQVVALPTETVYGLAANALDVAAVQKIFEIKGRPSHNPIIVHVASLAMAQECAAEWPDLAASLAEAFWPGPLTLVLPKAAEIPDVVAAGGTTVGIRWPSHPVFQAVIQACGFPLAAPSANLSTEVSPTTAEHVRRSLGDRVPLIVDGGPADIGIESTVLDLSVSPPQLLRPGMIHPESLTAVIGPLGSSPLSQGGPLRSPGLLLKHYSPKAKLVLWNGLETPPKPRNESTGRVHLLARDGSLAGATFAQVTLMPRDPASFAKALYAELHRADEAGAEVIVVETVPETPPWQAIADRLRRAAASG